MTKNDDNKNKPGIDADLVRTLARLLEETGLSEIEYGTDDMHLRVAKNIQVQNPQTVIAAPAATGRAPDAGDADSSEPDWSKNPGVITSPMVGVLYTAPEPGATPFVRVGDMVSEGQSVLLIEAMKVFNEIKAPRAGKVSRVFVSTGSPVEYGEPLMLIE